MAVVPIIAGSIASIRSMKRPENAPKCKRTESPLEDSDDEDESESESLSTSDAYMFPVIGSGVLFSMYLVFRYLDKKYIDYLITTYFSVMGCAAVTKALLMLTRKLIPVSLLKNVSKYKVTLTKRGKKLSHINLSVIHGALLTTAIGLTAYYGITKNWIASNIFGLSFSVNAIQLLSLDSFKTGMILLSGLFFYDIFWVFYTPVMVTVAKSFDAPIKLLWPRDIIGYVLGTHEKVNFTMLGLGDIVIPGIFVALCLRFDRHMSWKRNPVGNFRSTDFEKPYFTACMVAYIAGLATTMGVMHFFNAAQPALLYLSPACILSALITAAVRGEIKDLFEYTTEETEEEKKEKERKKKDLVEEQEITIDEKRTTTVTESFEIESETIELEQIDGDDEEEEEAETTGRDKGSQPKKRRNKKK
ncbi:hypothetical protein K501DRAFT_201846 [Backusella circina FSU 941]|nr:hypothetical protein K501DRAFT_201846 [Backusella circina FSU 941]